MTTCNNIILSQPTAGAVSNHSIPDDVSARLNFGSDDIAGLRIGDTGQLVIDFVDGGQLNITNFSQIVDNGNLVYLEDGTWVDPTVLTSALKSPQEFNNIETAAGAATNADAIRIGQPAANTTQEISLEQGMQYICEFDPANAATVEVKDGKMVLTFADGSQVIINNYQTAMAGELPAELTVEDGTIIHGEELLTQVTEVAQPVEEILQFTQEQVTEVSAEQVANIAPAAGDVEQALAQVEPGAGEVAGVGNTGFGFSSTASSAPLNSPDAIGPLGATQLVYNAPQFDVQNFALSVNPTPLILSASEANLDETNLIGGNLVAEGQVAVDFRGDQPGAISPNGSFGVTCEVAGNSLHSGGVPVEVTATDDGYVGVANGVTVFTFVIDAATGEYVYTQLEPFDHSDTTDTNEPICLHFGVVVTDIDGDSATTDVNVTVLDDAPLVLSQADNIVDETDSANGVVSVSGRFEADMGQDVGGSFSGTNTFAATGSVDNGALTSNGAPVVVSFDAATNTYTGVANGETVFTFTINPANGEYTYSQFGPLDHADASNPDDIINLDFGVAITDFDGDTATSDIRIQVRDDAPVIGDDVHTIDETNLAAGPVVLHDSVDVDFGQDGQGSIAPNGVFTSNGSQTGGQLTSNGVAVVVTQTANGYVGVAGGVTVFTLEISSTTGDYTFTQFANLDHADGNDANDIISLNFGTVITDFDGDSDAGTITINIQDDAPIASDDKLNTEEGETATGNVLSNDNLGADDATVTSVTFEGQDYAVPAGGSVTVEGNEGTLTMNSDGSYTYEANEQAGETIRNFEVVEPTGGDAAGDILNVSGNLNEATNEFTFSTVIDGDANGFTLVLNDGPNPKGLAGQLPQFYFDASGATPVVTAYGYNGLGGVPGTTDSAFDGSQAEGVQPADKIFSSLNADSPFSNVTVTIDANGNQVLSFTVDTDAINSHNPLYNEAGGWEGVSFDDLVGAWFHPVSGIETSYGADGFLTQFDFDERSGWDSNFTPVNTVTTGGEDTFTYEITDGDGDTSTAELEVCVHDNGTPTGIYGENSTDDTNLNDDGMDMVTGIINVNYNGDEAGSTSGNGKFNANSHNLPNGVLSHEGTAIQVSFDAATNTYTGVAGGTTVFTMVINADATYKFTQLASIDHGNTNARNETIFLQFGVTATDADGDTGTGVVQIRVLDDFSNAINDNATLDEGGTATGNVIDNDVLSADETSIVTNVSFQGVDHAVPATGVVTVTGEYGVLTLSADGSYTYVANDNANDGQDSFVYTLVDGDGDSDTATLNLNVQNVNDVPTIETSVQGVYESELCDHPITVNKTLVHDFGDDGAGAITVNGDTYARIRVGDDRIETELASNGSPVVITTTANNGYVGTANGQTIFTLTVNAQTGEYTYTQFAGIDHPGVGLSGTDDVVWLRLGVTITDSDGDAANAYVNIDIRDTAPEANDDTDSVSEGTTTTGNVLLNDLNCEHGSSVCEVVFGNQTIAVPATGTVSVTGQYGVLTIAANGTYSYKANSNNPDGVDQFTYTLKDQDGDTSQADLSITVTSVDGVPTIEQFNNPYSECGINEGPIVIQETLTHDFGVDGAGAITPTGAVGVHFELGGAEQTLTSGGNAVVFTQTADGYVGVANGETVISLSINPATGEYTYTQFASIDHQAPGTIGDDTIWITFGVQITDADGDAATTYIVIDVSDAEPVARDDVNAAGEGETVDGNVLSNDENCADHGNTVCEIVFGNQTITVPATGTVSVTGQYGVLTIAANGTYSYQANSDNPEGVDQFTYTIKDADGDTSSAQLAITVTANDLSPINVGGAGQTDDTNLNDDGMDMITGTINVNYQGDGPGTTTGNGNFGSAGNQLGGNLTSNGVPVNVSFNAGTNTYTGTAGGQTIFTMTINANGTYKFTQLENLDHSNTNADNEALFLDFGVTATDSDGDTGTGTVRITVRDDAPLAANDTATLSDNDNRATGNVLTNDDIGADDGANVMVTTAGTFQGQFGTLVLNMDGSYTYTRNGNQGGTDVFDYTMKDHDGDTSSAQLTISVANDLSPINVGGTGQTDDTNVDADGMDMITGTINVNYQGDGPGTTTGNGNFGSAGNQLGGNLTSNGVPVNVSFNAGTNTYTGTAGGQTIFTMTINANGTYKFTQLENLDHSNTNADNEALFLDFGVTATDSDGDTGTGTVRITVRDDAPEAGPNSVFAARESDLDNGPVVLMRELRDGDFGADGAGRYEFNGGFDTGANSSFLNGQFTSNGAPVNVTFTGDTATGTAGGQTVFTLVLDPATGKHTFTMFQPLDHGNPNAAEGGDVIWLQFGVDLVDFDGDRDSVTIQVDFRDGVPEAMDDTASIGSNGTTATGNVLTNDDLGADDGANVMVTTAGTFQGQFGTLVLNMDGSYTYTRNGREGGTDTFNYTMKDNDGDTSSAQLTVTVGRENDVPTITRDVNPIEESDFCDHDVIVLNDTLVHNFGQDGAGSIRPNGEVESRFSVGGNNQNITSDGALVTITQTANGYVGTAAGQTVFTLVIDSQTGDYTYSQFAALDHPGVGESGRDDVIWLNFGVTITDADGDSASTTIQLDIRDTAPEANDDKVVAFGDATVDTLSLNVTAGDVAGTQSSFTRDGITIRSNNGADLRWVNAHDGSSGVGIAGNGSDVVWSGGEVMEVRFANAVTAATVNIGEIANNIGSSITYTVFLADGTSVNETFQFTNGNVSNGSADITIDGYSSEIVGVDFTGGVSFILGDVDATAVVSTGGTAQGNVLINDEVCEDHDVNVTSISFEGRTLNIAEGGSRTIQGDNGTLTIKSDGSYSYQANSTPAQTVHSFNVNNPGGRDAAGDILNTSGSFNSTTNEFNFSFVIAGQDADGFTLVLNDGPNPKDYPGESAIFYFDASNPGQPIISAYGYNGENNFSSYRDGSSADGTQAPDRILGSEDRNDPFTNINVTTDANGNRVFNFSLDATDIIEHNPLYPSDTEEWTGVSFEELVGIWFHPVSGLETSYDANGNLTAWNFDEQSWYDVSNLDTQTTVIPGSPVGGEDEFTYTITDADGDTSTATLHVCVHEGFDNVIGIQGNGNFYGTQDADLFLFENIGAAGAAVLNNFDLDEDAVDVSNVVQGFDPLTDAINDFVYVTENNGDTLIQIDADGQPGGARENVARLDNVTGQSLDDLLENGNLIV